MAVLVKYMGRLGNKLFQYAYGRLLAEQKPELGCLLTDSIPGFPETRGLLEISEHPYIYKIADSLYRTPKKVPLDDLGEDDIILQDYFQDYKFYIEHKKKIREWFKFERLPPQPEDKLIIHARLGDYLESGSSPRIPMEFYCKLVERDKPKSVCFVTDTPNVLKSTLAMRSDLQSISQADIVSEDELHDFAFLASAKRLCIANSTFSWWAAWLSDAERIYYPDLGTVEFDRLWVHDEDRYIRINVSDGNSELLGQAGE